MMKAETDEHYAYVAVAVEEHEALDESMRNAPTKRSTTCIPWVLGALALVGITMISMPCHHHHHHHEHQQMMNANSSEVFEPEIYYDNPTMGGSWYHQSSSHDGPHGHHDHPHHHHHSHDGRDHHYTHAHSYDGPHLHHSHSSPHHDADSHSHPWDEHHADEAAETAPASYLRKSSGSRSSSSRKSSRSATAHAHSMESLPVPFLPPHVEVLEASESHDLDGAESQFTGLEVMAEEGDEEGEEDYEEREEDYEEGEENYEEREEDYEEGEEDYEEGEEDYEEGEEDYEEGEEDYEEEEENRDVEGDEEEKEGVIVVEAEEFYREEEWEEGETIIEDTVVFDYPEIMVAEELAPVFEEQDNMILGEEEEVREAEENAP